mgnify:CR=1 FL=1
MVTNQSNRWSETFASTPQLTDTFWLINAPHRSKGFASMSLTAVFG